MTIAGAHANQKRQQPQQEAHLAPDLSRYAQVAVVLGQRKVDIDEVVSRRKVEAAAGTGGEMHVPELLEIAAEVAALAFEEQVDAVAWEDLRDLPGAEVDNALPS